MLSSNDFIYFFAIIGIASSFEAVTFSLTYIFMKIHCHKIMKSGKDHICKYWNCCNYYKCPYNIMNRTDEEIKKFKRSFKNANK